MRGFSDGGFCLARSLSLASQGKTRLLVAGWWWWWWSFPCAARSLSLVALLGGGRRSGRPARSLSLARAASARRQYVFMVGGGGGGLFPVLLARCRSLRCSVWPPQRTPCSLAVARSRSVRTAAIRFYGRWWWWWSFPCGARSLSLAALLGGGRHAAALLARCRSLAQRPHGGNTFLWSVVVVVVFVGVV